MTIFAQSKRFMKKVVFITGASGGMGKVTGELLLESGYAVYGTSRTPERFPDHPFPLLPMDLENEESIGQAVRMLLDREGRVDILINNAGRGMMGPLEHTPVETVKRLFQTNVFGALYLTNALIPVMRRQGKGLIINVSSVAGFLGLPYRGVYSATKAAVMIFSEAYRYELKKSGIRVVDLCPGDFKSGIASRRIPVEVEKTSPHYEDFQRISRGADQGVAGGLATRVLAEKIKDIIRTESPSPRYIVAPFTQKILHTVKALLPGKWFEKIILKYHKL